MALTPSPQQAAFYDWITNGEGSCVVRAVAGAGKTTTLIHALSLMQGNIFFGAYNKAIAEEIKARAPQVDGAKIDVSTFHAAGFRFWRRVARSVKVEGNKCKFLYRDHFEGHYKAESVVLQLVSLAKQRGVGVLVPNSDESWSNIIDHFDLEIPQEYEHGEIVEMAQKLLHASIEADMVVVDFDDMIFAPLVHNVKVWEHDWVLVDEAQDTNATRRALALRMLKRGGRLVAVGDPHQAIYGFTGADSDSLDLIGDAVNAISMPLTVSYRCPKAIVNYAQNWVGHITAADNAPNGELISGHVSELTKLVQPGDAVLCRFTAPLVTYAYMMISQGIAARIEGRDVGEGLKALARRWKTESLAKLSDYLEAYLANETAKLRAKEKESKAAALEDRVECLRVLIARVQQVHGADATVASLLDEIDRLFGDINGERRSCVTFSTIHKSKGREWHRVAWLQTGPSPWARKAWEQGQEANLCYVAATRAKSELVLVDGLGRK